MYKEIEPLQTEGNVFNDLIPQNEQQFILPTISANDNDIRETIEDVNSINFTHVIRNTGVNRLRIIDNVKNTRIEDIDEYDLAKGSILDDLFIEVENIKIPRYSCACHKANLAIRHAISMHPIGENLKLLNSSNAHIRKSIQLNKMFVQKKSRLRIENATRWSSAYLMLESVKRAYDKNLFNEDNEELRCPISLKKVETYLQILLPAYRFSISFQNNKSPISLLIPCLNRILNSWETMELETEDERLVTLLIVCFKQKFKYEIESEIYKVINI